MIDQKLWLCFESGIARILGKATDWPPGYLCFVLRGNRHCFDIFTHMTKAERILLYTLSVSLPKNNCLVEIGSYLGASACFLAAAAKESKGHLYCIDTWMGEGMTEGPRDTYQEFLRNTSPYRQWITPLRGKSVEVAQLFHRLIDLLFIDADHAYDAVVSDLHSWLPKLRPDGWLLLHDLGWAEGVQQAVQEIVVPLEVSKPETLPNLYAVRVDWRRGVR